MLEKIKKSTDFINKQLKFVPLAGIITGSGLGKIVEKTGIVHSIPYEKIPNFPVSTVEGHECKLIFGQISSRNVVIMQGRIHFYEGYSMDEVTFPVRVLKFLGIKYLILTNASGGINPNFKPGDLMIHTDYINMMPNPLIGRHIKEFGERFPDMSQAYDDELIEMLTRLSKELNILLHKGCYVGVTGPTLETPAEYKYYHLMGGDAIGMSTVPEIIVANQMGIHCTAISVITNSGLGSAIGVTSHQDVLKQARLAEPKVTSLIKHLVSEL